MLYTVIIYSFFRCNIFSSISDWEWTASTLNPYFEGNTTSTMINDDR